MMNPFISFIVNYLRQVPSQCICLKELPVHIMFTDPIPNTIALSMHFICSLKLTAAKSVSK